MRLFFMQGSLLLVVSAVIAVSTEVPFDQPLFFVGGSVFYGLYASLMLWRQRTIPLVAAQLVWAVLYGTMMSDGALPLLMGLPLITSALLDMQRPGVTAAAGAAVVLVPVYVHGTLAWEWQLVLTSMYAAFAGAVWLYMRERISTNAAAEQVVETEWENRRLRRSIDIQEQEVREEERLRIARDIHDSVGHQLTALLMQAGVLRRSVEGEAQQHAEMIEQTAGEALEQTRDAVRQMRQKEIPAGVHAVIHLLRKLERESQMVIQWKAEDGFLSAAFTNDQHTAIYRFVQEGMTNAMKYGRTREVMLHVQIRGGRQAVLKMENRTSQEMMGPVGSGLTGLQERFDALGGACTWEHHGDRFTMEGVFPLERSEIN
ncbi:sensor histidine kinase [Alkalicoccus chagannorensis]|uniref:sensor histidine kinase n=1 Tax=Alkalicoccus chagannorensis TaxID=427072 RepID=UPI00041BE6A4|nr:histidine kinase [Alkalicoccus chagannorensis]